MALLRGPVPCPCPSMSPAPVTRPGAGLRQSLGQGGQGTWCPWHAAARCNELLVVLIAALPYSQERSQRGCPSLRRALSTSHTGASFALSRKAKNQFGPLKNCKDKVFIVVL